MAFVKKTWEDRDSEYPNRRSLTDPTTGTTEIRDIGFAEGDVYVEGDEINAENFNDLEDRIEDAINEIPITEVEVTPVVTDGETLATIRVNEDTSDIKMPKPFEVKITYASGEYTADKTLNEIYAAAGNGYEVYALYGTERFSLAGYTRSAVSFVSIYHTPSHKTSTIRSFYFLSNGTITLDSKILYNLPSISGSTSVGRLMTVISAGGENRYSLTTDNTIDDAHTNAKRTYSSQKVDAELQARDAEIALKADSADVDTALALKADKADTYTKSQVDTALSAKANTSDVTASLALKADKADTYTKTQVDTALGNKADKSTTYTKSEVDTALALKADETDLPTKTSDLTNDSDYQTGEQVSQAISEAVENKADTDGTYEDMTVGTAMKLVATRHTTDIAPYLFRQSGGDNNAYVGTEETDKLVGASAVVNQLSDYTLYPESTSTGLNGLTYTNNNDGSVRFNGTAEADTTKAIINVQNYIQIPTNHKVLFCGFRGGSANTYRIQGKDASNGTYWMTSETIFSMLHDNFRFNFYCKSGATIDVTIKPQVIDLTAMFGTTIADYIYSLEQATAGSGIAFLRKYGFFTKDYYPYTANTLQSVNTSKHTMVGVNRWDEQWELGEIDLQTGQSTVFHDRIRAKNYIQVIPDTEYYFEESTSAITTGNIYYYDANQTYIKVETGKGNNTFTTPSNCHYIRFVSGTAYGTTYNNDICINISSSKNGTYEAYVKHEYALPNIDLRGLYKLDASNNLYADGDTLEGDGTLTRKYGIVDLGTLTWGAVSGVSNVFGTTIPSMRTSGQLYNYAINPLYVIVSNGYNESHADENKVLWRYSGTANIRVRDTAYDTAAKIKAAMSGVYLIYELATPTTETATGFTNPQIVDKYGTEEYTDERDFPMPVGHETDYPLDSEMALPVPPVTAGTYNLKLTVDASGNQTYSWAT